VLGYCSCSCIAYSFFWVSIAITRCSKVPIMSGICFVSTCAFPRRDVYKRVDWHPGWCPLLPLYLVVAAGYRMTSLSSDNTVVSQSYHTAAASQFQPMLSCLDATLRSLRTSQKILLPYFNCTFQSIQFLAQFWMSYCNTRPDRLTNAWETAVVRRNVQSVLICLRSFCHIHNSISAVRQNKRLFAPYLFNIFVTN
jgi:hypothetical protein